MSSFKRPLSDSPSGDETSGSSRPSKRRAPTLYDAVAGRVAQWGLVKDAQESSRTSPYVAKALRPDEVLFKQQNAPVRYEENDYYFAHRLLPPEQKLPKSDLLKAIHAYISDFYEKSEERANPKAFRSMDETALIALGILVEESAREVLGETGHLAFLEGQQDGEETEDEDEYEEEAPLDHETEPGDDRGLEAQEKETADSPPSSSGSESSYDPDESGS